MTVWLPYADWPAGSTSPPGWTSTVYDGSGELPGPLGDVDFYVLPVLRRGRAGRG